MRKGHFLYFPLRTSVLRLIVPVNSLLKTLFLQGFFHLRFQQYNYLLFPVYSNRHDVFYYVRYSFSILRPAFPIRPLSPIIFKRDVDLDLAERIVRKAVRCCESKPVTVEDIIQKVCSHYEIEESAIHTKTRKREVVQVRQVAMYLAKKQTDSSSSKIGKLIGNKDHATVLHACKIVKDQVEVDKAFKADIEEIEASLKRK